MDDPCQDSEITAMMRDFRADDEMKAALLGSLLVGGKPTEGQREAWQQLQNEVLQPLLDMAYGPHTR